MDGASKKRRRRTQPSLDAHGRRFRRCSTGSSIRSTIRGCSAAMRGHGRPDIDLCAVHQDIGRGCIETGFGGIARPEKQFVRPFHGGMLIVGRQARSIKGGQHGNGQGIAVQFFPHTRCQLFVDKTVIPVFGMSLLTNDCSVLTETV